MLSDIAQQVPLLAGSAGAGANRPVNQFGYKQPVVQPTQTLEHPAVAAASRAGHRATQQTGLFGGDPQVERMAASWVFTGGSVDDSRACKILVASLHWSASLPENCTKIRFVPLCPYLDDGHAQMFQATHVPNPAAQIMPIL